MSKTPCLHFKISYLPYCRNSYESNALALDYAAPRSLNSDISYFGVGGKQAVFFIGTSVRVSDAVCLNSNGEIII
jgi:hypothetical protein